MARNYFDLSHVSCRTGEMGRIQTLAIVPVAAGDSLELGLNGIVRLSPLRRNLIIDARYDICAFYMPHRHIYGDDWVDWITQGIDETVTFDDSGTIDEQYRDDLHIYLSRASATKLPKWITAGYNRIWNRYYRDPRDNLELPDTWTPALASTTGRPANWTTFDPATRDQLRYGYLAGRLISISSDLNAYSNLEVAQDRTVPAAADTFDLVDLERVRARFRSETERDWFQRRYTDIMAGTWGRGVGIEADQRPEMLYRHTGYLSGYDVDAQDDEGLGRFLGKVVGSLGFAMPRKYFVEHGAVWLLMVMRFPPLFTQEQHYLWKKLNPSYKEFACEPAIMAAEPPVQLNANQVYADGANVELGLMPYGDWWRQHPPAIHPDFDDLHGYGFIESSPSSVYKASYEQPREWDDMFQSTPLRHWNIVSRIQAGKYSMVPSGQSSIFAGA